MADIDRELDLIARYKGGDKAVTPELFEAYKPLIRTWERNTSSTNLPRSAVNAEIRRVLLDALDSYDPNKGAQPNTYINSRMPKIYRFIYDHQNIGRLPENINIRVGTFKSVKRDTEDRLGREANANELSEELGWNIADVENMQKMVRSDLSLPSEFDFGVIEPNKTADLVHYIYYELTPQEKVVFEGLTGFGGKPKMKSKEIAARIGVSPATVSNIKKSIAKKLEAASR
jgi:DNA-directed RNA polymerase specialized sigma subunit